MNEKLIYQLIKTDCGRAKFESLKTQKGFFKRIRLYWFIFFASIRDFNQN
tara:strand:+ start:3811 stop:3960 length:150 start_codon:yes stop_codon:yes gene_type:complete